MAETVNRNALPRAPLLAICALVVATLVGVSAVRLSGVSIRAVDAPMVASRALLFADRPDGGVDVIDARDQSVIETVQGEAGFLRGALRALARERRKINIGGELPFELVAHTDGRLTLIDPATGERLDLESFGPTNAGVFARLLQAGR